MLAENRLHPSDFIWPLFVCDGRDCEEPIGSLPGVSRWSIDRLGSKAKEAAELGIPCIALFPNTPNDLRTDDAREAQRVARIDIGTDDEDLRIELGDVA